MSIRELKSAPQLIKDTAMLSNNEKSGVYNNLYEALERRRLPPNVAACFSDAVNFVILAAAAGVIGGLSYDVFKKCLVSLYQDHQLSPWWRREGVDVNDLEATIAPSDYESERTRVCPDDRRLKTESDYVDEVLQLLEDFRSGDWTRTQFRSDD